METNQLRFLLKLFDCSNHRAYLASSSFRDFKGKDKICQELGADGLIDFTCEIAAVNIAPSGHALLNIAPEQLPISDTELRFLEKIDKYSGSKPSKLRIEIEGKKLKAAERDRILQSFRDRGFISVETRLKKEKAEVWLTQRGLQCLEQLNNYFQSLRKASFDQMDEASTQVQLQMPPPSAAPMSKPTDAEILQAIRDLDRELATDNYLPIFHLRQKLQPPLSREELDRALYRLQRNDQIELSSLQEGMRYTPEQIDAAIHQDVGRRLFFIIVN